MQLPAFGHHPLMHLLDNQLLQVNYGFMQKPCILWQSPTPSKPPPSNERGSSELVRTVNVQTSALVLKSIDKGKGMRLDSELLLLLLLQIRTQPHIG
jgi:hypothetical protein